jgi:hypothetical protein
MSIKPGGIQSVCPAGTRRQGGVSAGEGERRLQGQAA